MPMSFLELVHKILQPLMVHLSPQGLFTGSTLDWIFSLMLFLSLKTFCNKEMDMRISSIFKTSKSYMCTSSNIFLINWSSTCSVNTFSYFIIGSYKSLVLPLSCLKSLKSPLLSVRVHETCFPFSRLLQQTVLPNLYYYIQIFLLSADCRHSPHSWSFQQ